ncbi:MAG: hypothetical protein ABI667_03835 [Sphingomicrobium sp.]
MTLTLSRARSDICEDSMLSTKMLSLWFTFAPWRMPASRLGALNIRAVCILATFGFMVTTASTARAGTCEATFIKQGNVLGGLRFIAMTSVADLSARGAIEQMRGIVVPRSYDILVEEAEEGSMLIEQPRTEKARAFPITITATTDNGVTTVRLDAKLSTAMMVKTEAARFEMCGMLAELRGGKAGLERAAAAKNATLERPPLRISALELSSQVSKDTERNAAAVSLRYKHRRFTVTGMVDYVRKDGRYYRVAFKIPHPWEQGVRLPGAAPFKTDISCLMAPGQAAYALTLKPDRNVKLTGTFHDFDEDRHVMWLDQCRPEL